LLWRVLGTRKGCPYGVVAFVIVAEGVFGDGVMVGASLAGALERYSNVYSKQRYSKLLHRKRSPSPVNRGGIMKLSFFIQTVGD